MLEAGAKQKKLETRAEKENAGAKRTAMQSSCEVPPGPASADVADRLRPPATDDDAEIAGETRAAEHNRCEVPPGPDSAEVAAGLRSPRPTLMQREW